MAGESSQASGVISFKLAKTTWGGSCCQSNSCTSAGAGNGQKTQCNLNTGSKLKMFAVTDENRITHSYANTKTGAERHQA